MVWDTETTRRINILAAIILAVIGLLVFRLAWLQVFQGAQYKKIADENRIREIYAPAPRGMIYDRNGRPLVTNRPSFTVSVIPAEYGNAGAATPVLASITGMRPADIDDMIAKGRKFPHTPVRLKRDVDQQIIAKIEERKSSLAGVFIEAIPARHYIYNDLAAHLVGYIGRISEEEYLKLQVEGYRPDDLIGKDGLELMWEDTLRGIEGGRAIEVNALGQELRVVGEKAPVPGKGLVLTIDFYLQKQAEAALADQIAASRKKGEPAKGGAVVVLDPRNGAVLAIVSNPAFDPGLFAAGISSRDWNSLISSPNNPLSNRCIQGVYPPGSVFKIVTAAAAMDLGLTTPEEVFEDKGVYILDGWRFYGWQTKGLGRLKIDGALAWSSDPVFYELGRRIGVDALASYAVTFGYGEPTGIKLPGEAKGVVPTEKWKLETYQEVWYPGETLIAAIGQGYYLATPVQQAVLLAAVANGGTLYQPMLVDRILSPDEQVVEKIQPVVKRRIYLQAQVWEAIKRGLEAVVSEGTAALVFKGFDRKVAGKTGSAETGKGTTHAWFACYAPADNPEIVVAAFVEDGGEGSAAAAPIARKVLEAYFGLPATHNPPTPPKGATD